MAQKYKINFKNASMVCEAADGETVLEVAVNNGVPMQHACGGFCACTTCHFYIEEGAENIYPIEDDEKETLSRADDLKPLSRLGCQAKIKGDLTVHIVNLE
jgi:2Fe-2S ferredoxin